MIDDIFGIKNNGVLCHRGLADPMNKEQFWEELKILNTELKRWVNSNLPIDLFINKLEMSFIVVENKYRDAISDTGYFSFSNKYKYLTNSREWFMWDAVKYKIHRKLSF